MAVNESTCSSQTVYIRKEPRKNRFADSHPYRRPSSPETPLHRLDKLFSEAVSEKKSSQETVFYPNRSIYVGELFCGKKHGKGKLTKPDGSYYEGDWVQDKKHGKGIEVNFDETGSVIESYEGSWVDDEMEGDGKRQYEGGYFYEGKLVKGKHQGRGKYICPDGSFYEGEWENGIALSNISNLSEELFFKLLCDPENTLSIGPPEGYCLGIMADYLQKNGYLEIGKALSEAHRIFVMDGCMSEIESGIILKELVEDKKCKLFASGTFEHAIGIHLVPDSDFIICEIFNTGEGLKYHTAHPDDKRKYKTMLQLKIPLDKVDREFIEECAYRFGSVEELYEGFYELKTEVLSPDFSSWQTEQKGSDCSLRWIFAFCKNKMEISEYRKMVSDLKSACKSCQLNQA